jgi:hypothetical protein
MVSRPLPIRDLLEGLLSDIATEHRVDDGLRVKLKQTIQNKDESNWKSLMMVIFKARTKKRSHRVINLPVTMASVLAAFLSLLASSLTC